MIRYQKLDKGDIAAISFDPTGIYGTIFFNKFQDRIYILEIIFEGEAGSLEERLFLIETVGDIEEKYTGDVIFLEKDIRFVNLLPFYKQKRVKILDSSDKLNKYEILKFEDVNKEKIEEWIVYTLKSEISIAECINLLTINSNAKKVISVETLDGRIGFIAVNKFDFRMWFLPNFRKYGFESDVSNYIKFRKDIIFRKPKVPNFVSFVLPKKR